MKKEIWKDVLDYEEYQASNFGKIRSLKYGKVRILKPRKDSCGYLQVDLYKDGKHKHYSVHRLVWEAFVGKIPDGYEVNHIDEDKTNNFLFVNPDGSVDFEKSNLNLMTRKENINYGTRTERCSKRVLQFTLDWKFVREWPSTAECGRNGFCHSAVVACCKNCYSHEGNNIYKGFIWMYADDFFRMLPEI